MDKTAAFHCFSIKLNSTKREDNQKMDFSFQMGNKECSSFSGFRKSAHFFDH
jgi:hypothetical protein